MEQAVGSLIAECPSCGLVTSPGSLVVPTEHTSNLGFLPKPRNRIAVRVCLGDTVLWLP